MARNVIHECKREDGVVCDCVACERDRLRAEVEEFRYIAEQHSITSEKKILECQKLEAEVEEWQERWRNQHSEMAHYKQEAETYLSSLGKHKTRLKELEAEVERLKNQVRDIDMECAHWKHKAAERENKKEKLRQERNTFDRQRKKADARVRELEAEVERLKGELFLAAHPPNDIASVKDKRIAALVEAGDAMRGYFKGRIWTAEEAGKIATFCHKWDALTDKAKGEPRPDGIIPPHIQKKVDEAGGE